jgi:hypothetical protein
MAVTTKNGWIFGVRELEASVNSGAAVPAASTTVAGKVKQITFTAQATTFVDLAAATAAYNALLTKLIAAGIMPAA